jgi:hypothetical protein
MAETSAFLVPATPVPMASQIRCVLWHDNEMSDADLDDTVTPGARIGLTCLIRLNGMHDRVIECIEETRCIV